MTSSIYASERYWNERYLKHNASSSKSSQNEKEEWFMGYDRLKATLDVHLTLEPSSSPALFLGSGLSLLPFDMVADNFFEGEVWAVDFSQVCIEQCNAMVEEKGLQNLHFEHLDVRRMDKFSPGFFRNIIDKATLDTLFNYEDSESVNLMLAEVYRLLCTNGVYFVLSYSDDRAAALGNFGWSVSQHALVRGKATYHLYVMNKK